LLTLLGEWLCGREFGDNGSDKKKGAVEEIWGAAI